MWRRLQGFQGSRKWKVKCRESLSNILWLSDRTNIYWVLWASSLLSAGPWVSRRSVSCPHYLPAVPEHGTRVRQALRHWGRTRQVRGTKLPCTSGSQRENTQNIVGRGALAGYWSRQHRWEDIWAALEGRGKRGCLERRVKPVQKYSSSPRVGKGASAGKYGWRCQGTIKINGLKNNPTLFWAIKAFWCCKGS